MRISYKVTLLVAGLLVSESVCVGLAVQAIHASDNRHQQITNAAIIESEGMWESVSLYQKQQAAWTAFLLYRDQPAAAAQYREALEKFSTDTYESALAFQRAASNTTVQKSLDPFLAAHKNLTEAQLAAVPTILEAKDSTQVAGATTDVNKYQVAMAAASDAPLRAIHESVVDKIEAEAAKQRQIMGMLVGLGAFILALGAWMGWRLTRGISRPLRKLSAAANQSSTQALPAAVDQIALMTTDVTAPPMQKFTSGTRDDELAQMADAMTDLQSAAVGLAVRQRQSELASNLILVNLGRRTQNMISRILQSLSDMEKSEQDPGVLERLYTIDHQITRTRRHADTMVILAGAEQTRKRTRPVSVHDVIRGAVSEIEEYTRVSVHEPDSAMLYGSAAADVAHLLAELVENAVAFSPPGKDVVIGGRALQDGYRIDIRDTGLGLSKEEMDAANAYLAGEGGSSVLLGDKLGHAVVREIAARRDIHVTLVSSDPTGITARVTLPPALLLSASATAGSPGARKPRRNRSTVALPASSRPTDARPTTAPARQAEATTPAVPAPVEPETAPAAAQIPTQPPATPATTPAATAPDAGKVRRVRGANLGDLARPTTNPTSGGGLTAADASRIGSQLAAFQSASKPAPHTSDEATQ